MRDAAILVALRTANPYDASSSVRIFELYREPPQEGNAPMQTKIEDRAVRRSPFTRRAPVICLCAIALLLVRVDTLRAQGKAQLASDTEAGAPEKPADLERRVETLACKSFLFVRLLAQC